MLNILMWYSRVMLLLSVLTIFFNIVTEKDARKVKLNMWTLLTTIPIIIYLFIK